jgi:transposase
VETPREKQLLEQLRQRDKQVEELKAENALLRQRVDLLIRKVFGPSSEKLDPSQLDLFLQGGENSPGKEPASSALEEADPLPLRRRAPRSDKRLPEDLPVVEQVIDPEEVKAAPDQWRCIGSEVSEQLDYEPARFLRRRLVRRKYVSKIDQDAVPVIAELPAMLQQRSTVAPGLLAQIIVSKYVDHRAPRAKEEEWPTPLRNCTTDEGRMAPRDQRTGAGLKSPSAAVVKSHGREHRRKRSGRDRIR